MPDTRLHDTRDPGSRLPRGATGFDPPGCDQRVQLSAVKSSCHHVARQTGARLVEIVPAGVTPVFHTIRMRLRDEDTDVVVHSVVAALAFAESGCLRQGCARFVDHPVFGAAFEEVSGLRVYRAAELQRRLSDDDLVELREQERRVVRAMRPETVGELLFNYWD